MVGFESEQILTIHRCVKAVMGLPKVSLLSVRLDSFMCF